MSERFVDVGSVDNFIAEKENKATLQTTRDAKLLQTVLGTRNELRKVVPAQELNEYISVRTKNRKDYEQVLRSEVYWQVFVLSLLIVIIVWKKSQYLWNKHITAWKMLCTIFIQSLFRIRQLTRSLRSLVRFLILLNSWIRIVRAHFPWNYLYNMVLPSAHAQTENLITTNISLSRKRLRRLKCTVAYGDGKLRMP